MSKIKGMFDGWTKEQQLEYMMADAPEVRAAAFKFANSRKLQAQSVGVNKDTTEDEIDELVISRSEAKAEKEGKPAATYANGQQMYIEGLVQFMDYSDIERYAWGRFKAFPETASADDMLAALAD